MDSAGVAPQPLLPPLPPSLLDSLVSLRAAGKKPDEEPIKLASALGASNTVAVMQNDIENHC